MKVTSFGKVRVLPLAIGCITLVATFATSLGYQQQQSSHLLKVAQSLDQASKFDQALHALDASVGYWSTSDTRRRIALEESKSQRWQKDLFKERRAASLVLRQQDDQAMALIRQISSDYPNAASVRKIGDQALADKQKATALAAAKAKAAADAVAQAAADAAAKAKAKAAADAAAKAIVRVKPPQVAPVAPTPVYAPPGLPYGSRYGDTSAITSLNAATSITQAQQSLQVFANQYNLSIEITPFTGSSYANTYSTWSFLVESDLASLKSYGAAFIDEWAKYPLSWVSSSHVARIAIVKDYAVEGQFRAAGPDPVGQTMYYDIGYGNQIYAREVIHHEFDHLLEYYYFGSYNHNDPTWQSYNTAGFAYGNGGSSAYGGSKAYLQHPQAGFVTGYATYAIEEDKAELYAYLMTGSYYHDLKSWIASDSHLSDKVAYYKQFILSHAPEMTDSYFDSINP